MAVPWTFEWLTPWTKPGVAGAPVFGGTVMVIVADEDRLVSVFDVAVSMTVEPGTAAGAVYVTELGVALLNVPQAVPEHADPETFQVTPRFCASFWTVAVN